MKKLLLISLVSSLLIGCGGGGDTDTTSVVTPTPDTNSPLIPIEPSTPIIPDVEQPLTKLEKVAKILDMDLGTVKGACDSITDCHIDEKDQVVMQYGSIFFYPQTSKVIYSALLSSVGHVIPSLILSSKHEFYNNYQEIVARAVISEVSIDNKYDIISDSVFTIDKKFFNSLNTQTDVHFKSTISYIDYKGDTVERDNTEWLETSHKDDFLSVLAKFIK